MKLSRMTTTLWATSLLLMLATSSAWPQFSSGLEGTVCDPTGAIVPNAAVTLHEANTGVEHTAVTSSVGIYRFTALPPSIFSVTVKASGFQPQVIKDISIQVAETRTLNVNLKLGGSTEMVNVTAEVTPVNSSTGAVSGVINETKVH